MRKEAVSKDICLAEKLYIYIYLYVYPGGLNSLSLPFVRLTSIFLCFYWRASALATRASSGIRLPSRLEFFFGFELFSEIVAESMHGGLSLPPYEARACFLYAGMCLQMQCVSGLADSWLSCAANTILYTVCVCFLVGSVSQ